MIRLIMPSWRTYDLYEELEREFENDFKYFRDIINSIKLNGVMNNA